MPPDQRTLHVARPVRSRLVYLIGQLSSGGAERQLFYLLQALPRERYRPAVVVWNYRQEDRYVQLIAELRVPVHPLSARSEPLAKLHALRRCIRELNPEVIHSYSFFTNVAAHLGAMGTGAVAIGSIRGDYLQDLRSTGRIRGAANARWPRFQIYNSICALKNARTRRVARPRAATVVRNGLDLERFHPRPCPRGATVPTILGVGSLLAPKRWDRLLLAAAALKRRQLKFQIEIVGDGPMRTPLEQLARRLGVADVVRFVGHLDRIEAKLQTSSCLAHPSESEGCPNVVMEAMACGRAVVATDSGDAPLLVENGHTGFVVGRLDDMALVEPLGILLGNYELCCQMGRAGRLKAEREFGLGRLAAQTLEAYRAAGWNDRSASAGADSQSLAGQFRH